MNVHLKLHFHDWRTHDEVSVAGTCFVGTDCIPVRRADLGGSLEDASGFLAQAGGFFAMVRRDSQGVMAAVDKTRSIPLFYSVEADGLYLSDDANWIAEQIGHAEPAPTERREFLACGYVTGSETLHPRIRQLQVGEVMVFAEGQVTRRRYYLYQHREPRDVDLPALSGELAAVLGRCADRLLTVAGSRTIVLPLSGGYDSRLIATLLHERQCRNIVSFSYGRKGNFNAELSRKVAGTLGFDWHFIEYDEDLWEKHWCSDAASRFRKRASNLVSLPHPQDWPAIRELLERGMIDLGSVVVPGHTGDFLGGGHTPERFFSKRKFALPELTESIAGKHYKNIPVGNLEFSERIASRIDSEFDGSNISAASLFDLWEWQERQAKYIINSVRAYDESGLSWWLPLFDPELMEFFSKVPLDLRRRRLWFRNWIDNRFAANFGAHAVQGNADDARGIKSLIVSAGRLLPLPIRDRLRPIYAKHAAEPDPMAFSAISGDRPEGYNMFGQWAAMQLDGSWGDKHVKLQSPSSPVHCK